MTRGAEPGYRRQPKVYRLTFDDHPGLVVRAKSASVDTFLQITELEGLPNTPEIALKMFRMFADRLLSWNLEYEEDGPIDPETDEPTYREGDPVPATYESMLAEDWDFIQMIINGWMDAAAGVSAPLAQPSTDGSPSLVESIPMDVLSPSRAS